VYVPIHVLCLFIIVFIGVLTFPIIAFTSSFALCSVQLIFSIFLHISISKVFSLYVSSYLMIHVSDPYRTTPHILAEIEVGVMKRILYQ